MNTRTVHGPGFEPITLTYKAHMLAIILVMMLALWVRLVSTAVEWDAQLKNIGSKSDVYYPPIALCSISPSCAHTPTWSGTLMEAHNVAQMVIVRYINLVLWDLQDCQG